MGQENNTDNNLLNQIASKIVSGSMNWTADELQYQRNHPDLVEKALHEYRKKADAIDRIVVIHYDSSFLQIRETAIRLGMRPKILSYPEAAAMALLVPFSIDKETSIAIMTIVDDVLDVALITIDDGVWEVRYTNCVPQLSADKFYRIWWETRLCEIKLDRLLIVTEDNKKFQHMVLAEKLFGLKAECFGNLQHLVQRGREILAGVMTGETKNFLLLSVTSLAIGIEMEGGLMLPLVEANTMIPTRVSKIVVLDAGVSEFRVDIRQGNECNVRKNELVGVLRLKNHYCQQGEERGLELMVDIDSNLRCICRLTDKDNNVSTELQLL